MKHKYKIINYIASLFILCSMCLLQSCSNSLDENSDGLDAQIQLKSGTILEDNEFRVLDKIFKNTKGLPVWEAQLETIIETDTIFKENKLELIGYKYVKDIKDQNELEIVKNDIVRNKKYFVKYKNNSNRFSIEENEISNMDTKKLLDLLIVETENEKALLMSEYNVSEAPANIHLFKKNDMALVNLEWKYKGEIITTSCIVSNKEGLIYDDILINININVQTVDIESRVMYSRPRLKSTTETGDTFISKYYSYYNEGYNYVIGLAWTVKFQTMITGYKNGNVKRIQNAQPVINAWHEVFYDCKADFKEDLVQGVNGHAFYHIGYSQGWGTVTLAWRDVSVAFEGSGEVVNCNSNFYPSDLY